MIGTVVMLRHPRNKLAKDNLQINMLIERCDGNRTFRGKNLCDFCLL